MLFDGYEMADARTALIALAGEQRAARAFAVAANFQMMNRLLDGIGVGLGPDAAEVADALGVELPARDFA